MSSIPLAIRPSDLSPEATTLNRMATNYMVVSELIRTSPKKNKNERFKAFQADSYKTEHVDYLFYLMEVSLVHHIKC